MADNTTLNPGTGGDVMASNDIGGVKYQRVKVTYGAAGTANDVSNATALPIQFSERAAYVCNTGPITGATATGTKTLAYLWHPSTVTTLKYQLSAVNVNIIAGVGGSQRVELRRITAENVTPGGTTGTLFPSNPGGAASGATVRIAPTGAPTFQTGVYNGGDVPVAAGGNIYFPNVQGFQWLDEFEPFTMRASSAEGFVIVQEVTATITTAPTFNITFFWTEL